MYIKMVGDNTKYQGSLERVGTHLIKVSGLIQHTTGFMLYADNNVLLGDYSKFVYPYLDPNLGSGIYMYSDNNITYEEEQNTPTKEELERQKIIKIIDEHVGNDVRDLIGEVNDLYGLLGTVYESMGTIEELLTTLLATTEEESEEES